MMLHGFSRNRYWCWEHKNDLTNLLGTDINSIGWIDDGGVYINSVLITTIDTYTTGDVLSVAVNKSQRFLLATIQNYTTGDVSTGATTR